MARTDSTEGDDRDNNGDSDLLPEHDLNDSPRNNGLAPPVVSNRNIGSGRSRSRHRHRHHRHRSLLRCKRKESNFVAAVCSMIVLVLLCTALAEPQWFYLSGGGCRDISGNVVSYIGVNQYFYLGRFRHTSATGEKPRTEYQYGPKDTDVLVNCVTVQVVSIMKSIISLSFFGIGLSLIAFLLDLSGPTHKVLKVIRRHGILNILTVGFCVVINGFSYWATEDLTVFQQATKRKTGSKIDIEFSISFFLITAAGAVSVVAAACNLLRRHSIPSSLSSSSSSSRDHRYDTDRENLLSDMDGMDFGGYSSDMLSQSMTCLPPPPPYSP